MKTTCAEGQGTAGLLAQDGAEQPSQATSVRPSQNWSGQAPQTNQQRQSPRTRQEDRP